MISSRLFDGDTFEHEGCLFQFHAEPDDSLGAPWEEHDGHGPVSEWTTRAKRPGEMVLCSDGESRRYYDFAAATQIAKRDGWGPRPADTTARAAIRAAVLADFDCLRRWCNDDWCWIGIVVTLCDDAGEPIEDLGASLWGIESDWSDYHSQVALDLAAEVITQIEHAGRAA